MARAFWLILALGSSPWQPGFAQTVELARPSGGAVPAVPAGIVGRPQSIFASPALSPSLSSPLSAPSLKPHIQVRAVAASLPIPASLAAPKVSPDGAKTEKPVITRLAAPVPFEAPKGSDWQGGKEYADQAFQFKVGEAPALAAPAAPEPSATQDDGGGPDYPSRSFSFRGKTFKTVLFRPNVPVEQDLVRMIDAAQKSVHIAVYEFKLSAVLDALRRARRRGVEVHLIVDFSNVFPQVEPGADYVPKRSQEVWALLREEFDVKVLRGLGQYGINHNKFAVVDYDEKGGPMMAEFGSFNWSWTAENSHYENANFTDDAKRIQALKTAWDWLEAQSQNATYESKASDYVWSKDAPVPPADFGLNVSFNGVILPSIHFSPDRRAGRSIEDSVVAAIKAAKKTIDVAMFALRSTRIVEALQGAHARGVKVRVIIDEGQSISEPFGPYTQWLAAQGIEVKTLAGPDPASKYPLAQKMHHKFSIFDGKLVETGSANYTKYSSLGNYENAHFLDDATDAKAYAFVYEHMWQVAKAVARPQTAPVLPTDEELVAEVEKDAPPIAPLPPNDWPAPKAAPRQIRFNGRSFDSYILRPDKPVEPRLVEAIDAAKKSVKLALYEFDLEDVMDALRRAKKRKVQIQLVIDWSHVYTTGRNHNDDPRMPSQEIQALIAEGFDVKVLRGEKGGIQHNKYGIFDGAMTVYGSYNWAKTAEKNHFENIQFSDQKYDAVDYTAYFEYMRGLASEVDKKKLKEVLSRSKETAHAEEASAEKASPREERQSKFPPPPESTAPQVDLNGQKFHRHYFSPQGQILDAWLRAISAAKSSIEIAMFGFYSEAVADALVAARKANKDLTVRLVLDAGQSKLARIGGVPVADWFSKRGFDVKMLAGPNREGDPGYDPMFEKQHNKLMIVDGKFLLSGSFNQSPRAENYNFENDNATVDPTDLAGYVDYFERMYLRGWDPKTPAVQKPRKSTPAGV